MVELKRLAWLSYFNEFRWSRLKKNWTSVWTGSMIYLYIVFTVPSILMDLNGAEYGIYLSVVVPMVITAWTMQYSGVRLPKLMIMGPMSRTDRKEYLQRVWKIRFWFPNVIMIASVAVRVIMQPEEWLFGILIIIQNILMSCGTSYAGELPVQKVEQLKGLGGICIGQMFLGLFAEMILLYYYASKTDGLMKGMMITWGFFLAIQLWLVKKLLPYKQKIFDLMIDYESAYAIQDQKGVKAV